MSPGFEKDPHSERGNACPRNRFGIADYQELQPIETVLALKRARQLEAIGVTGTFDSAHLRAIHKYLFQDVFPWAGEFRVVNISKGNSMFGPGRHIAGALADALAKLKAEAFLIQLASSAFAARAAFFLGEINAIHPFREGTGRAQREFVRQLALPAGTLSPGLVLRKPRWWRRRFSRIPGVRLCSLPRFFTAPFVPRAKPSKSTKAVSRQPLVIGAR